MLEPFGWNIGMDALGAVLLVAVALIIGGLVSLIGEVRMGGEWALTAVGALVGGWLGSEAFAGASTWGPEVGGWFVLPSVIGAVVLGVIVDAITRYATDGSYRMHSQPI